MWKVGGFEMRVNELKKYIIKQGIKYQVEETGVWYVCFADMSYSQREYIMCPYFAECGFSSAFGIHF